MEITKKTEIKYDPTINNNFSAIIIAVNKSSWFYVISYSIGWVFTPMLIIVCKIINRGIKIVSLENGKRMFISLIK